ncbi:MAG: DUF374 domain-containing protein [Paracoccaceae bacterium]|jgi:lysophospholipid acyltransferase (LPLAT)-like uncharacterized protein|nr:DUF374 domain-containing protein [Paracoccaceae bacterium]
MMARAVTAMRKKVAGAVASPAGQALPAALIAAHLRRAFGRTDWLLEGRDALADEARAGPVVLALWHGRLMCAARFWDTGWGPLTTLTSQQYPGRLAGQALRRFGLATRAMHDRRPNRGESLALAREMRGGMSIGVAVDGPLGPARKAKTVSLDWARLTGAPIWLVGFSATRFWQMDSWDRLVVPRAGGRACLLYRRFGTVDKRATAEVLEAERARLEAELDAVTGAADRRMGHAGPIC